MFNLQPLRHISTLPDGDQRADITRGQSRAAVCLSMIPRVKPEGMLFGKPDSTRRAKARGQAFPDHALVTRLTPAAAESIQ
jgi:hypothetical protein